MNKGRLVELGARTDLLARNGLYATPSRTPSGRKLKPSAKLGGEILSGA